MIYYGFYNLCKSIFSDTLNNCITIFLVSCEQFFKTLDQFFLRIKTFFNPTFLIPYEHFFKLD
jgi:hypothetical protein